MGFLSLSTKNQRVRSVFDTQSKLSGTTKNLLTSQCLSLHPKVLERCTHGVVLDDLMAFSKASIKGCFWSVVRTTGLDSETCNGS